MRSYLQCIKSHTATDGCAYCRIQGVYRDNWVTFIGIRNIDRKDKNYAAGLESNQISDSPLKLLVPLKSTFPPEYMHSACLGVMRKLCNYYFRRSKNLRLSCQLSSIQLEEMSIFMDSCRKYIPVEFQRKLRSMKELEHYKATEFRTLLLYLGPFI